MIARVVTAFTLSLAAILCGQCGSNITTEYPNRLYGADGQSFVLEDIEAIVNDEQLTDDQKRSQLRDLGIEDEELIQVLLTL